MTTSLIMPRSWLIYGLCIPLAILVGYLLATPQEFFSYALVGLLLIALSFPLLIRWHHAMLVCCWNASIIVFFLPGRPALWTVFACVSLFFSVLNRMMRKSSTFLSVPSITWPLICLMIVVIITIALTGGIGGQALGSDVWGGKRYLGLFGAVIGYFALTAQRIPVGRAGLFASAFFLSGMTALGSDIAYAAGPGFYFLYAFFPTELAASQAFTQSTLFRLTGVTWAAMAAYYFMLMRFGVRGLLEFTKPWRLGCFLALISLSLLGGYRSSAILLGILFLVQFYLEGLMKSHWLPVLLLSAILGGAVTIGFISKMPLAVQRSLSFLPLDVDTMARQDAQSSLDWRLRIWKTLLPEVPKYFWLGKSYSYSGTDYYLTQEAIRKGLHAYTTDESILISGNYHNGPLTIIIPFGVFGLLAFLWFCGSSLRLLYANYRFGEARVNTINAFLLNFFVTRLFFFLVFYGQSDLDLCVFTGTVGLSISINGGVRKASEATPDVT